MEFGTIEQHAHYQDYMKKVDGLIRSLPAALQADIRMELNSHIFESLQLHGGMEALEMVLARLGDPAGYVPEWVAQKKLEKAVQGFDPFRIGRALFYGIRYHGAHIVKYVLFGLLYMFAIAFALLSVFKLVAPDRTGLFLHPGGKFYSLGFNTNPMPGAGEQLGWWFIPICLLTSACFFVLITLLLRASMPARRPLAVR
jgi:hypothetical protein